MNDFYHPERGCVPQNGVEMTKPVDSPSPAMIAPLRRSDDPEEDEAIRFNKPEGYVLATWEAWELLETQQQNRKAKLATVKAERDRWCTVAQDGGKLIETLAKRILDAEAETAKWASRVVEAEDELTRLRAECANLAAQFVDGKLRSEYALTTRLQQLAEEWRQEGGYTGTTYVKPQRILRNCAEQLRQALDKEPK